MNIHNNCHQPDCSCCNCMGPMGPVGDPGPRGPQGVPGQNGADGKSAFEAAQEGGFTGTEAEFNFALANISNAILSTTIRANEVVTMAQYQTMRALGELDPNTAYDVIEEAQ